jgi:Fic/DOC family
MVSQKVGPPHLGEIGPPSSAVGLDRDAFLDPFYVLLRRESTLFIINAVHPFREGNGRTQRAFLRQLAAEAGYDISWDRLDPQRNVEVSRDALIGDLAPLRQVLDHLVASRAHPVLDRDPEIVDDLKREEPCRRNDRDDRDDRDDDLGLEL